jgi:hypothetical protein
LLLPPGKRVLVQGEVTLSAAERGPSRPPYSAYNSHGDHVGGCAPIIDAMPARMMFDSGQQHSGRAFRDCMHEAATHGVQIVRPQRGFRWSDDGVRAAPQCDPPRLFVLVRFEPQVYEKGVLVPGHTRMLAGRRSRIVPGVSGGAEERYA